MVKFCEYNVGGLQHWLRVNGFIANGQEDLCSFVFSLYLFLKSTTLSLQQWIQLETNERERSIFWKIKFENIIKVYFPTLMSESTTKVLII